jgi:hypothetical protein
LGRVRCLLSERKLTQPRPGHTSRELDNIPLPEGTTASVPLPLGKAPEREEADQGDDQADPEGVEDEHDDEPHDDDDPADRDAEHRSSSC